MEDKKLKTVDILNNLVSVIADLKSSVDSLVEKKSERKLETNNETDVSTNTLVIEEPTMPVPVEYRAVVDMVLNKNFGIHVASHSDRPAFTLTIVVPDKYSNMSAPYREMYKADMRPKVISYAEGSNGVKEWCEKVYNNLSAEARAQVVEDRLK